MTPPAVWIDITAHDPERTHRFYAGVFGWRFDVLEHLDYALVDAGPGGPAGGVGRVGAGPHPAGVVTYVTVDDVDRALERARELGATVVVAPWQLPGLGAMAVLADPDGNRVGVWAPPAEPDAG